MKKYIKPELETVELEAHEEPMLASNVNNQQSPATQLSKERLFDDAADGGTPLLW